jgi:hypothetical protein
LRVGAHATRRQIKGAGEALLIELEKRDGKIIAADVR